MSHVSIIPAGLEIDMFCSEGFDSDEEMSDYTSSAGVMCTVMKRSDVIMLCDCLL